MPRVIRGSLLCSGQVIGRVSVRAPKTPHRALALFPTHERKHERNRCDYKFLANTLTSDINTARETDRRGASRVPMTVTPLLDGSVTVQRVTRITAIERERRCREAKTYALSAVAFQRQI